MLGDSSSAALGSSSGDASAAAAEAHPTETAHDGGGGGGEDERIRGEELGDRSFGGNRWPRQETIALLKIRSDMDVAFRDASVKGPLWEDVSRKLAELGYHRSAKKCKEKFENVYKYHKRTKEGRTGKPDGKTYRFFDQLQALENQPPPFTSPPQVAATVTAMQANAQSAMPTAAATPAATAATVLTVPQINNNTTSTVPSVSHTTTNISSQGTISLTFSSPPFQAAPTNPTANFATAPLVQGTAVTPPPPPPLPGVSADLLSEYSTSSSTSSDDELEEGGGGGAARRRRKRKWKDFFERLMAEVIHRQEELQRRFLEAIEKREHDRMVREEAWRMQEMTRINREREILAQERSMAAAKDAAVMAFLQKISDQQNIPSSTSVPNPTPTPAPNPAQHNTPVVSIQTPPAQPAPAPSPAPPPPPPPSAVAPPVAASTSRTQLANVDVPKPPDNSNSNRNDNLLAAAGVGASSSRWPKVEVHALIRLRTSMDGKYQENGPKGPLWEEISEEMRRLGYNRNAKRCKEKWENINKYFKKVKESNKRRPEDSKTCPYFHQLEALYREKTMKFDPTGTATTTHNTNEIISSTSHHHHHHHFSKTEINTVPLMVQPEQQWPPPPPQNPTITNRPESAESDQPMDRNEDEDDEDDEDEEEDEEGGDNYELVANKANSRASNAAAAE